MSLWIIWLVIAGLLIVVEMLTLTFYLLWIAAGALVATVVAIVSPDSLLLQVVLGCIVALLLTVFTKPLTRRMQQSRGFKDAIDELVGQQGVVAEDIGSKTYGIVKVGNETWSASADAPIMKGEIVVVTKRGSAVLHVSKWRDS